MSLRFICSIFLIAMCLNSQQLVANTDFKQAFMQSIKNDPRKAESKWYQRALLTISCDDCEYIPKVAGAGKIFAENDTEYQLMHNGIKIYKHCYYGAWMTAIIEGLRGHHEPQEEKAFYEVLKTLPKNSIMLELGSYWAYYSLWFAQAVPGAKNFLIEPRNQNINIGKLNFKLNNKEGSFYQGFVGKHNKNFSTIKRYEIDQFLEDENISHLNILHSDIQGSEYEMLKTCKRSIAKNKIDYFFVSTHSEELHKNCIAFLKQHNFEIVVEHSPKESFSCDGLIVGKRHGLKGPEKIAVSKRGKIGLL